MQGKRADKVAELVQMELSSAVLLRLKDPRIGFITITRVEMSNDLQIAKVFYSVLGDGEKKRATGEALEHARGFLQRDVGNTLKLRYTPHLQFHLDESADHSLEVENIIKKIHTDPNQASNS